MNLENCRPVILAGAGKMGMAMASGWISAGLPSDRLTLIDPKPSPNASDFAKKHNLALRAELPDASGAVLVLAVKPQIMGGFLPSAAPKCAPDTLVLSIAAGISLATLAGGLSTHRIVRTMPNTPAQIGKGISGAVAAAGVDELDRETATALLSAAGKVVWLREEGDIDALTAVSGSGPAYVFHLVEAMAAAGIAEGLDAETSSLLARQTVIGAASLLEMDPAPAAVLRENVTSPNGTTAAALDVLMGEGGLTDLMQRAVRAARKRSEELGS